MKLPSYVKSKKYFDFIPLIGGSTANTISTYIFLPNKIYKNLKTDNPNPKYLALLAHEEVHRKRQIKMGSLNFTMKYIFNPRFRLDEEIEADKEYIRILKKNKIKFELEKRAKQLSGPVYFWPVDFQTAKSELEKISQTSLLL